MLTSKLSKTEKFIVSLFSFVVLVFGYLFLSYSLIFAQVPKPYVPCGKTKDPEFHSLRPYQASPCDESPAANPALFCGGDLVFSDSITVNKNESDSCVDGGGENGKDQCRFTFTRPPVEIAVDLSGAEFPIAGNTQLVVNSQSDDEKLNDTQKVSEYISWYLNGTTGRAEYPFLDIENEDDISKIVNYSGPIKRLFPQQEQIKARIKTVEGRGKDTHDQIVGCTNVLGVPIECSKGGKPRRLSDWAGNLPPLEEEIGDKYEDFTEYWKAYQEWRGKFCFDMPFTGGKYYLCGQNPFKPDYHSSLFGYIPLALTEDSVGEVEIITTTAQPRTEGMVISNVSFDNQSPAELFFPHTIEINDLTDMLQKTFKPKDSPATGDSASVDLAGNCSITNVRTNPGDDLFAGEIKGELSYTADFTCDFEPPDKVGSCITDAECSFWGSSYSCNGRGRCEDQDHNPSCTVDTAVSLSLKSKSPSLDDIWQKTVAGPASAFRRLAPQINLDPDDPIACLLDIPSSTEIELEGENVTTSKAELFFPHLGGVYDYFLKGIQSMIQPKGFANPITKADPGDPLCKSGEGSVDICGACNPEPVSVCGDKELYRAKFEDLAQRWLAGYGSPRVDMYDTVWDTSCSRGVSPVFSIAIWLHESGASNYAGICQKLAGGNTASEWCHQVQDFGFNNNDIATKYEPDGTIIADHLIDQLNAFLNLPGAYIGKCGGPENFSCPMELFGAQYVYGECVATSSSNGYIAGIKKIFGWIAGGEQFPCYPTAIQ